MRPEYVKAIDVPMLNRLHHELMKSAFSPCTFTGHPLLMRWLVGELIGGDFGSGYVPPWVGGHPADPPSGSKSLGVYRGVVLRQDWEMLPGVLIAEVNPPTESRMLILAPRSWCLVPLMQQPGSSR